MGLKKQLRLRRKEDFDRLRLEGDTLRHRFLVLNAAPNGLAHNRYGVITSKRLGNAVTRNRIRRQFYEAVRLHHSTLQTGYDLVLVARPDVVGQSFHAIANALNEILQRAGLPLEKDDYPQ